MQPRTAARDPYAAFTQLQHAPRSMLTKIAPGHNYTMKGIAMRRTLFCLALLGLSASGLAQAADPLRDAQRLGCDNCHAMSRKLLGPGWLQVAQRYRALRDDPATLEGLVKKVSRGGGGAWGKVPMIAADPAGLRQDEIRGVLSWVLHLPGRPLQREARN